MHIFFLFPSGNVRLLPLLPLTFVEFPEFPSAEASRSVFLSTGSLRLHWGFGGLSKSVRGFGFLVKFIRFPPFLDFPIPVSRVSPKLRFGKDEVSSRWVPKPTLHSFVPFPSFPL